MIRETYFTKAILKEAYQHDKKEKQTPIQNPIKIQLIYNCNLI